MSAIANIKYQTEGRAEVRCDRGSTDTVAFRWVKGNTAAVLHSGDESILLSKSQLEQIADLAKTIAVDLVIGEKKR